jgi:hypothetical protein
VVFRFFDLLSSCLVAGLQGGKEREKLLLRQKKEVKFSVASSRSAPPGEQGRGKAAGIGGEKRTFDNLPVGATR